MPAPDKNKQKRKYEKASALLTWMFGGLCVVNGFVGDNGVGETARYITIVSCIFSVASGYVAYLHSKLPQKDREKVNWFSASDFNMHPYITFALFVLLSMIGLMGLLIL